MDADEDMVEMHDGSTDSDGERDIDFFTDTYDDLRHALLVKDKTSVLQALKILRKNSSEREGTSHHKNGMQVASRLTPEIVNLFKIGDQDIQENATWVLVNISAGNMEQARTIITTGAIPFMAQKLHDRDTWEGHAETELNIVWCFMNLATDREEFGKVLIGNGVVDILISMVEKVPASHLLLTTIAALAALQTEISWDLTCRRLPDVLKFIQFPNDKDELDDACRSLDYLLKRYNRQQLAIPETVISKVPSLVRYLNHSYRHVQRSARSVLNTIAAGSDEESQAILDAGILPILKRFLMDQYRRVHACTLVSKLTAGNANQIQQIIDSGVMTIVINIVCNFVHTDVATWKEAAWAVANALDGRRTQEQFKQLVRDGPLEAIAIVLAQYSSDFAARGDKGVFKQESTSRFLRCLDQASIHLPSIQPLHNPSLIATIEEVFSLEGYRTYQRDSKNRFKSPDPDKDFEQKLTLAMKRFTLEEDPEDALTKQMNTVKIKESEEKKPIRSPFHYQINK